MTTTIRPLRREDMAGMIALAAAEGWNPGLTDATTFHAADPEGFLGLFLNGDDPAAVISLVRYGDALAFLGLYIARPEHRGKGLGYRLWQAAIEHAGGRPIGLDGVPAQQANYRRSGFDLLWRNIRFAGPAPAPRPLPDRDRMESPAVEAVLAYDTACFGANRRAFLAAWLAAPGHRAVAMRHDDGRLAGFGVVRPCAVGHKIGPLFADDAETAADLLTALTAPLAGSPVILDVPEPNAAAVALARSMGWAPVFETARMMRGTAPPLPLERVFGITSFELG